MSITERTALLQVLPIVNAVQADEASFSYRTKEGTRAWVAVTFLVLGSTVLVLLGSSSWNPSLYVAHGDLLYTGMKAEALQVGTERASKHHHVHHDGSGDGLLYLNNTKAFEMLDFSKTHRRDDLDFYYYISQGWEAQINQAYCAIATTAAVMNSFRGTIELPQDPVYKPFHWATQVDLLNNTCVQDTVYNPEPPDRRFWGMGLEQAGRLMNCHLQPKGFHASVHHVEASTASLKEVRHTLRSALENPKARLAINFDRGGIGQGPMGHGHFSPIGAYDEDSDSFLIMDVAKYKYPPVWVKSERLMNGIGTLDHCGVFEYPKAPLDPSLSLEELYKRIGCRPAFRGYILIEPSADE